MKKIITLTLALLLALSLVACGGKKAPTPAGNNEPAQSQNAESSDKDEANNPGPSANADKAVNFREMNEENWSDMLKKSLGLELTLPEGWKVSDVFAYNNNSSDVPDTAGEVELKFSPDGDVTPADFGATVFEAIKKLADSNGIFDQNARKKSSYDEAFMSYLAVMCANLKDGRGIRADYMPSDFVVSLNISIDNYPHSLD